MQLNQVVCMCLSTLNRFIAVWIQYSERSGCIQRDFAFGQLDIYCELLLNISMLFFKYLFVKPNEMRKKEQSFGSSTDHRCDAA